MSYLLDTNTVSELTRPHPDTGIVSWLAATDEHLVFLSVVTIAEVRYGIDRLPPGRRRAALEAWLSVDLLDRFAGRILAVDTPIADRWGRLVSMCQGVGRPIGGMDAFLAATADCHELTLVTRNVAHFAALNLPIICPWSG